MNPVPAILLRCFLALALVTGGIPAWGMDASQASTDVASDSIAADTDESNTDCHGAGDQTAPDSTTETSKDDCCDKDEQEGDCTHENCNCVCPAMMLVLPVRSAPAAPAIAQGHAAALSAHLPQKIITTLLRPPRA